jgi:hypothetical protein
LELGSEATAVPLVKNPVRKGCADSAQASIS